MTEAPKEEHKNGLVKSLVILAAFFCMLGLIALFLWLVYWRYEEVTDDSYVNGNRINIVSQIEGRALSYYADNTNYVTEGQLLIQLDPVDFNLAYQNAKASLAETVRTVRQLIERTKEQEAILQQRYLAFDSLKLEYLRRKDLVKTGAVAEEDFINSLTAMDEAEAQVQAALFELNALKAVSDVQNIPSHPLVQSAIQKVKESYLNLGRCKIYAPASGFVAQRTVQVGQWITPEMRLLSIIPYDQMWVDANFKETQLSHVRIDQPVELISDMYGKECIYHGKVVGIAAGTGSVFSILPPQNATGNWIKIVQRVPVKISLDQTEVQKYPLSLGLSMITTIDTHDRSGLRINEAAQAQKVAATSIYKDELAGIEEQIEAILKENGAT